MGGISLQNASEGLLIVIINSLAFIVAIRKYDAYVSSESLHGYINSDRIFALLDENFYIHDIVRVVVIENVTAQS